MRAPDETTREYAARALGVSIGTIQRLEKDGLLTTRREDGRVYIPMRDVERARAEWKPKRAVRVVKQDKFVLLRGRFAARCFPLFEAGVSMTEIVKQIEVDPFMLRELYEQWQLSLEDGKAEREREREQKRQDRLQRAHERRLWQEKTMRHRLELARIEARGGRRQDAGPEPAKR